jgi:peptidyl-prolyl cis-trans isomerase C
MKSRLLPVLPLCVCLSSGALFAEEASTKADPAMPSLNDPLLTVNGEAITANTLQAYHTLRQRPTPKDPMQAQTLLINEMTTLLLVAQDAKARELDKDPRAEPILNVGRDLALVELAVRDFNENFQVSDEQLQKAYDEAYGDMPAEYKASHILVEEEDKAKELISQLNDGADFAELAKAESKDLGWFVASSMVKPFGDAVMAMEKGSISAEPVQSNFGWHIISLEDSRTQPAPALDEVRAKLVTGLRQDGLKEYINSLQAKGQIELKALAPAEDQAEAPATN